MTAEIEGNEENVALTNAAERMRMTSNSCWLAATAAQCLSARERSVHEPELVQERG